MPEASLCDWKHHDEEQTTFLDSGLPQQAGVIKELSYLIETMTRKVYIKLKSQSVWTDINWQSGL